MSVNNTSGFRLVIGALVASVASIALILFIQSLGILNRPIAKRALVEQELRHTLECVKNFHETNRHLPTDMEEIGPFIASPKSLDILFGGKNKPYIGIAFLESNEDSATAYLLYVRSPAGGYMYAITNEGTILRIRAESSTRR